MKKGVIFIAVLLLLPFASAEILFGPTDDVYNMGDKINIAITLKPNVATSDFFTLDLVCGEGEGVQVFRSPYSLGALEEKKLNIELALERSIIEDSSGECFLKGTYGSEIAESSKILFSRSVIVEMSLDGRTYNPGDIVSVSGTATLENGDPVEGFIDVVVGMSEISFTESVVGGEFSFGITLPEDFAPGEHELSLTAYEKDGNNNSNWGSAKDLIRANVILSGVDIESESFDVEPGNDFEYLINVFDQVGSGLSRDVRVEIYNPDGNLFVDKIVKSLETATFVTKGDYAPGAWTIKVAVEGFDAEKKFYVSEKEAVDFMLENSTLTITNIGNVKYDKEVEIKIGEHVEIKRVELGVGKFKQFKLSAPDAEYSVSVKSGEDELSSQVSLTGNAISIGDLKGKTILNLTIIGGLVLLILVIILIIVLYKKRTGKSPKFGLNKIKNKLENVKDAQTSNALPAGGVKIVPAKAANAPASGAFIGGKKAPASVVALNVKNSNAPKTKPVVDKALMVAKHRGAKIYVSNDFRVLIFTSALTKTENNDELAAKIANIIEREFLLHNRRARDKISFGIGINSGQVIVENHGGGYKLTALGTLIMVAKRIASAMKNDSRISDSAHGKLGGEIKTKALGNKIWKIVEVLNRQDQSKFLSGFQNKTLKGKVGAKKPNAVGSNIPAKRSTKNESAHEKLKK